MKPIDDIRSSLAEIGLENLGEIHYNLNAANLYEHSLELGEAAIAKHGALIVDTGPITGRSAKDKALVEEPSSKDHVWWGEVNKPFTPENYKKLKRRLFAYLQNMDVYVQDCFAGADAKYRLPVRIVNEYSWHNLFARNMFIEATDAELNDFAPEFTVVSAPNFRANPDEDGTRSEVFIILDFSSKLVIIGGTEYAGEIKKSIFTVMNYLLPLRDVFPMHCSANRGANGDVALFFGLSGTGKTTLSADPERQLIGDDEHGWSDDGVFNFEGGCYAKVINLSAESEPIIFEMTRTFGTILENVVFDPVTRDVDLFDSTFTENTRASYPRNSMTNIVPDNKGSHPQNVFFLTADAFGVMPPISRLTPEQAMYHFLSGYTAKVAGTEAGVKEPTATFSTCFGAPFMVHQPAVYAKLLRERINNHNANVWLVNTGWTGGEYGVGTRMKIGYTRAMLHAALNGELNNVEFEADPFFNVAVPKSCPGVPDEVLNPRNTWSDKDAYDKKARHLSELFAKNFVQFEDTVGEEVTNSCKPQIEA